MLPPVYFSTNTVLRSLTSVCNGGFLKDGANHSKDNVITELVFGLQCLVDGQAEAAVFQKECWLEKQTALISQTIVNARPDAHGAYQCVIYFGNKQFLFSQPEESPDIEIIDCQTGEKDRFEDLPFPTLQKYVLQQYMVEQYTDLSEFDLVGIDVQGINFKGAVLSLANAEAIINGGGSLCGAKWKNLAQLDLATLPMNAALVDSLISDGANEKAVLKAYFASAPSVLSHRLKAVRLDNYIQIQQAWPVDLTEFDLSNVNVRQVNFTGTVLSQANVEAIIRGGGNLSGALFAEVGLLFDGQGISKPLALSLVDAGVNPEWVLKNYLASERNLKRTDINIDGFELSGMKLRYTDLCDVDPSKLKRVKTSADATYKESVQANFEHDLLKLLARYSETVTSYIVHSSTWDERDKAPAQTHDEVIRNYVRAENNSRLDYLRNSIKSSTGNCGEMAPMCKSMIDLYLMESLRSLGYQSVVVEAFVCYASGRYDHELVILKCAFEGVNREYIIDPWMKGAWKKKDGMAYLSDIWDGVRFFYFESVNSVMGKQQYRNGASDFFAKMKVKEHLDSQIKKSDLLGMPLQ